MIAFFKRVLAEKVILFYLVITLTIAVPLISLVVLGFFFLWDHGWLLWFGLGLLCLSALSMLLQYLMRRDQASVIDQALESEETVHLPVIADWSSYDNQVWGKSLDNIARLQLASVAWTELTDALRSQLSFVARTYHKDATDAEYAFTVPELLLMMEVFSRQYRSLVLENVPFSQQLKVSTVMGYSQKATATYNTYKKVAPIVNVVRAVLTAGSSIPGQLASAFVAEFGTGLTVHMQKNMKQLLFEQVSQVAIDLYSGRLTLSDDEMALYQQTVKPPEQAQVQPLIIMVVGQVNAGKSSLVNALLEQSVAEVDLIAATDGFHPYQLSLAEGIDIILMDSPGLDGTRANADALLKEATKADLLLWLSQADQPAKALDKQLMDDWDQYFMANLGRKKPPVLLVTTHNDMLKPQHSWQPPYDLDDVESKKAQSILAASRYTREALGLADIMVVPIALRPGETPYNVDVLRDILVTMSSEARAAQLNRERLDAARSMAIVSKTLSQAAGLANEGVKLIFR